MVEAFVYEKIDGPKYGPYEAVQDMSGVGLFANSAFPARTGWYINIHTDGRVLRYQITAIEEKQSRMQGLVAWELKVAQADVSREWSHEEYVGGAASATTYNISDSSVQFGNQNTQIVQGAFATLTSAVEQSAASTDDKETAKGLLQKLSENPTFAAIVGGAMGLTV